MTALPVVGAVTGDKPLWAKCDKCSHCWPCAYLPIDMAAMARVLKHVVCPKGCKGKPLVAKQRDGKLLEQGTPS